MAAAKNKNTSHAPYDCGIYYWPHVLRSYSTAIIVYEKRTEIISFIINTIYFWSPATTSSGHISRGVVIACQRRLPPPDSPNYDFSVVCAFEPYNFLCVLEKVIACHRLRQSLLFVCHRRPRISYAVRISIIFFASILRTSRQMDWIDGNDHH